MLAPRRQLWSSTHSVCTWPGQWRRTQLPRAAEASGFTGGLAGPQLLPASWAPQPLMNGLDSCAGLLSRGYLPSTAGCAWCIS